MGEHHLHRLQFHIPPPRPHAPATPRHELLDTAFVTLRLATLERCWSGVRAARALRAWHAVACRAARNTRVVAGRAGERAVASVAAVLDAWRVLAMARRVQLHLGEIHRLQVGAPSLLLRCPMCSFLAPPTPEAHPMPAVGDQILQDSPQSPQAYTNRSNGCAMAAPLPIGGMHSVMQKWHEQYGWGPGWLVPHALAVEAARRMPDFQTAQLPNKGGLVGS